jgi:hypothetical protein
MANTNKIKKIPACNKLVTTSREQFFRWLPEISPLLEKNFDLISITVKVKGIDDKPMSITYKRG